MILFCVGNHLTTLFFLFSFQGAGKWLSAVPAEIVLLLQVSSESGYWAGQHIVVSGYSSI